MIIKITYFDLALPPFLVSSPPSIVSASVSAVASPASICRQHIIHVPVPSPCRLCDMGLDLIVLSISKLLSFPISTLLHLVTLKDSFLCISMNVMNREFEDLPYNIRSVIIDFREDLWPLLYFLLFLVQVFSCCCRQLTWAFFITEVYNDGCQQSSRISPSR